MSTAAALQNQNIETTGETLTPLVAGVESDAEAAAQTASGRFDRFKRVMATGMASTVAALGVGAMEADTAEAGTHVDSVHTEITTNVGGKAFSWEKEVSTGKVTFLAYNYAKGLPKKYQKKENCYIDRNGGWNSGSTIHSPRHPKRVKDVKWFKDNRPTKVCHVPRSVSPTGLAKAKCGNLWMDKKPPVKYIVKTPVVMVRDFAKTTVKATARSKAYAHNECRSLDGTVASIATASGNGKAESRINLRMLLRAKGRGTTIGRISGDAEAAATSEAGAYAETSCRGASTPPISPPTKYNLPPSVHQETPQHVLVNGTVQVRAYGSDPEGQNDIRARILTEEGNGNFVTPVTRGNDEGEFFADYKAGTTPEQAAVTATVIDSQNHSASDRQTFPVVDDPRGQF